MKDKTIKYLEENKEEYLHDFGVGKDFWNAQKVQVINCTTLNAISGYQKAPLRRGKATHNSEKRYLHCT